MLAASKPAADENEAHDTLPPTPASERPRSGEHKRLPREALATLPDVDEDFEHHDTIPAPPWIEEPHDAPKAG